ncbi:MAG: histone deacetylase [Steroidobacteraceae bacterium]
MHLSHHPDYCLPLPDHHPFPMAKYTLVHRLLVERGIARADNTRAPDEASLADLARVHTGTYLDALARGTLSALEQRRIGVPWSARLWRRSRLAVQGTLDAARAALATGIAGNLAGGTHHAFADHGEGFCVLNDVAVAIRALQAERRIARALVVDLDVHQGNGTAAIFAGDESVLTFSMHGERNYPAQKMRSSVDVALPDGTDDARYHEALDRHLPVVMAAARADIVFYLAGVDVVAGDRYGRFAMTEAGLLARERFVLGATRAAGLPTVITLAGGYAATPERTAALHLRVFEVAASADRGGTA